MPLFSRANFIKSLLFLLSCLLVVVWQIGNPTIGRTSSEILWDTWGVPHIFSNDSASLFQSFGWAQTQSHGNLILRLYGQARGRAAEYWGEEYLQSDQYVRTMGIPTRAQQWYEAQSSQMQEYLDAFAEGINSYVEENPDRIDGELQVVLPITGVDILAHMQRAIHFHFVTSPLQLQAFQAQISSHAINRLSPASPLPMGSNAWAIAPSHSTDEQAMLLANPHLPWSDLFLLYEAHLNAPQVNSYGATLVGMPFLAIAFNDNLGWTLTVNTFDGADIYELTLADGGYIWDGEVRPFEVETQTIEINTSGTVREELLTVRRSVHGPVIAQTETKAYALRVVGLDRPQLLEQFWQMAQATTLEEWETALSSLQLPLFNLLYSDRLGHILYVFNALVPLRSGTWEDWQGVIPGDTSATLWTDYHSYQDLPRLLDPSSGWLQNTNDPPWTSTLPRLLDPQNYPAYLAPAALGNTNNIFRPQRSIKLLQSPLSFAEMIAKKFSSRLELADRLLDELIPAARLQGNSLGLAAAEVLDTWDRETNAESRGAVLFALWSLSLEPAPFATPWNRDAPLTTPDGIADLTSAVEALNRVATQVQSLYGSLDVTWGEVVRLRYEGQDLPASGGPGRLGSFRVLEPLPAGREFRVAAGDTYIAAVEFAEPIRASALTAYGNATQPGSIHIGDQLPLYARGELRPVWRTRSEIEAHLEARQVF